ncbi:MAG TPA: DUF4388 domain-containing protein [Polyangiaceae bacterium]
MQLQGRLRLTTLGDLLGALLREGVSGTLQLIEERGPTAGRTHSIHLVRGRIVQVESPVFRQRLGDLLTELGWMREGETNALLADAQAHGCPFGQLLVELGIVPVDILSHALREQIRQVLEPLFLLEDARIAFRVTQARRRELDVQQPLTPEEYLVGRPRARDRSPVCDGRPTTDSHTAARRRDLLILGLGPVADDAAIRSAFRRLARMLHPDRHPSARPQEIEALKRRFVDVSAAYHRLAS